VSQSLSEGYAPGGHPYRHPKGMYPHQGVGAANDLPGMARPQEQISGKIHHFSHFGVLSA